MQIGLGRAQAVAAEAAGMVWSSPNSGPLAGLPPVDSNQLQMMQNLDIWSWTGDEPFPFSSMFDDSIFSGLPMQSPASTMRENLLQTAVLLNNATGVILPHLLPFPNTPANDTPLTLAACATATPISAHPELLGKHGTREQAAHVYVLRAEEALLNRKSDSVETVLAMLMMAGMAYSLDQGWKAHKWIAEAHLTCERHLYNCTNIHQLTIRSLLKDPKSAAHKPFEPSPEQREDRRMAWIASIIYATYCAMASGLPAGIEESDYVELLYEGRAWEDGFAQGRAPVEERNAKRVNAMKGLLPVRHSIFEDYCGAQHGYLEFASQTSGPDTRLLQICFLVRRVLRLINRPCGVNNSRPGDAEDEGIMRGTGAVLGVLGNAADERMIHDAVVEWHGSLSPDERVFESLGIFRDGQVLTTHETPPRWVHNPATVHNILLFLYAICLLHMPREGTELGAGMGVGASFRFGSNHYSVLPTPQFRIDTTTAPPIRVPSSEILTLARRAMVYLLRTIHTYTRPSFHPPDFIPLSPAKLGDGNNGAGTGLCFTPFDPSCPAPPMSLVWPVMSTHCINVVALACLAGVRRREGISGGAGNGQSNGGAGGFAVDNIVNPPSFGIGDGKRGSYQSVETREVGNDIRMVLLPVLDNLSRVWPMGRRYAARVRQTAYELFGE
ncbi:hypothetical protein HK097_007022 [Rhizophlyctis rosea]|uniref:Uncharacterized protein n=1 Tax=Rhizophlyctis rosea TaxID=64517 RepID=A0AAD5SKG4_9FUNG|nr:hypothetical protein HK097_007022 [Rhizophlyctis rosea]